jgi:HAD superfamily hydrolase (TIGR01509 family)
MAQAPDGLWPPSFGAAVFDFDGTLSDTSALWRQVDRIFLAQRGLTPDAEYSRAMSTLGFAAGAEYTVRRYGLDERPEDICLEWNRMGRALYETQATLRPGAEAYLRALRDREIPIGLATTNDPDVLRSMRSIHVDRLFDVVVTNRECPVPKDRPDIYLTCADRLGHRPDSCIVFEDIVPGIRSARGAGFLTCAVRTGDGIQHEAQIRREADLWLEDWRDVAVGEGEG